ncbi:DUF4178 domain-containing protein [Leisingera sp. ANG-Vp]|uniref:DUF4178 domain-containing protein n=1 Tax=Leisingera sp. ANG-Vp TaxID=1577896 RepID=UPI00057E9E53|nr:DUF4178 domain-containing protein [Leisingera sp. ANG-Vp]KIC20290.1 hypothetical protein RA20_09860 [Leisingera sp. ANG-Vp]
MSLSAELKAVDCTSCGAGLDILGGGRVTVHICPYCGTELDALDNYRAVRKFNDIQRPVSPFEIGMTGTLFGAEYTVIGTLQHEERWGVRTWIWVDHQLYSPTHGYAWLTIEDRHLVFTRRFRRPVWMSADWVERAEYRPKVHANDRTFQYYDTSTSQITFAEGEFTWSPVKGQQTTTVSALADDAMLGFAQTGSEREAWLSQYLPVKDAEAGFGIKTGLKPYTVHPLQQFKTGPNYWFVCTASAICAFLCLMIGITLSSPRGETVLKRQVVQVEQMPVELPFEITDPGWLARLDLKGDTRNSWAYVEVELTDPEDEPVFQAGRTVEYYQGRDKDGSWSEGDNQASLTFRPEMAGTYTLSVEIGESGLWSPNFTYAGSDTSQFRPALGELTVSVESGLSTGRWLFLLAAVFGALSAQAVFRLWWHRKQRWSGSDWVDEDDD